MVYFSAYTRQRILKTLYKGNRLNVFVHDSPGYYLTCYDRLNYLTDTGVQLTQSKNTRGIQSCSTAFSMADMEQLVQKIVTMWHYHERGLDRNIGNTF